MMIAGTNLHMTFRSDRARRGVRALGAGLAFAALAAFVSVAAAQQPGAPPPANIAPQAQPAPPNVPAAASPRILPTPQEVFSGIGRLIDQSIANVNAGVKGAGDTLGGVPNAAGDLAKGAADAAGTIARLPGIDVVKGWERCAEAPNGAPDCDVASVALCKTKGYERGKSLDITSAHKCPAQVWLEGRQPAVGECKQESFVSRAICQ
jgi:hypothetical protein